MSTDPLYHAWNCVGYEHVKTEVVDGALRVVVAKARGEPECAGCGSTQVTLEGTREVSLRAVPIGQTRVYLVLRLLMLRCRQCHVVRQEKFDLAAPRKSYTRQFAEYVLVLTRYMTLQDVAELLKVGWDLVKEILKQDLERRAALRSWKGVRRIAIDEIAVKKGHKYLTVVVDLDSGEALYTAEGHDHTSLEPFFKRLEAEGAKLEAIAVDMGTGYRKGIELYAPKDVAVIYDHFHIVSAMNAVISEVRRGEQNRLEGEGKRVLKGSRYLLLYGKETLADDPDKRTRLDALLAANEVLHKVWLLKEDLRTFWQQENKGDGRGLRPGLDPQRARSGGPRRFAHRQDHRGRTHLHPLLVRPPHHHGTSRRAEQQDQGAQADRIWLPRHRLLRPPNPLPPPDQVQPHRRLTRAHQQQHRVAFCPAPSGSGHPPVTAGP